MAYMPNMPYLACMPYDQNDLIMVIMGVYQTHNEKLANWSKQGLIGLITSIENNTLQLLFSP